MSLVALPSEPRQPEESAGDALKRARRRDQPTSRNREGVPLRPGCVPKLAGSSRFF
jgi:hypothetical protein